MRGPDLNRRPSGYELRMAVLAAVFCAFGAYSLQKRLLSSTAPSIGSTRFFPILGLDLGLLSYSGSTFRFRLV